MSIGLILSVILPGRAQVVDSSPASHVWQVLESSQEKVRIEDISIQRGVWEEERTYEDAASER